MNDRTNRVIKALEHYMVRLEEQKKDDDIKRGSSYFLKDLGTEIKTAQELVKNFELADIDRLELSDKDMQLVYSALTLLIKDMKDSKKLLTERMGFEISTETTDDQIKKIEAILNIYSTN